MMEVRKDTYTEVNELLSTFFDTATEAESRRGKDTLLKHYREIQIWGSDEVARCFNDFLESLDLKSGLSQGERNLRYKKFIIAMRRDLLGKTSLAPEELTIPGQIN